LGDVGEVGEEGAEEGPTLDKGEQIQGVILCSTSKAQRNSFSKEELSNKSTSLRTNNKTPELNLTMSTSSGS